MLCLREGRNFENVHDQNVLMGVWKQCVIPISISNLLGVHATGKEEEQTGDRNEQQTRCKVRMWFHARHCSIHVRESMPKEVGIRYV